eukprot:CAMPEP_0184654394 /NCGR_PEP_ID=MMETSP0308-20130426/12083_1 /TAXON_ID=38269 /ORGANISM="Gloeochaete witrockiana, Strain SAG 46.84" /LENGTH=130 /DNA_ID=CAMNT_0027090361 /DNA_START=24 /DNA_END=413 /DNA_ORIENTATION=+
MGGKNEKIAIVKGPGKTFKYLGTYLTTDLKWDAQFQYLKTQASLVAKAIARTSTAQEAIYITNAVLMGKMAYGLKLINLSETKTEELEAIWQTAVKHGAGLSSCTSKWVMRSHLVYGMQHIQALQAEVQI